MRAGIRFCWQSGAIALAAIIFAFLVPGVALCRLVSLASIASAITITPFVAGFGLYLAAHLIEKRDPQCERVDHYLQASIPVTGAGLLWLPVYFTNGPGADRGLS